MQQPCTVTGRYGFNETVRRIETAVKAKGMTLFAVIGHQASRRSGLEMQPAKVIVSGTQKAGTPLMVKDPQFALRLPLRVPATESGGSVQVVFYDTRAPVAGSGIAFADVENSPAGAEMLLRKTVTG